jgi:hypothetical protein
MANADKPVGAVPYGKTCSLQRYVAGGTIYPGDFVKIGNDGKVVVASASNALLGVAASYAVASGDVMVYDDPEQKFVIQSDDATEPAAQTAVGLNFNIVATAGDSSYKASRMELDGNTGATSSVLPLRLIELAIAPDNAFGAQAKCVVKINNHQLGVKIEGL